MRLPGKPMKHKHYYHVYADGQWRIAVDEHAKALQDSELINNVDIYVGIVGSQYNRDWVKEYLPFGYTVIAESNTGAEQVTMNQIDDSGDDKILYAHTKGAFNPCFMNQEWRRSMTEACIIGWKYCVDLLDTYDAVGSLWKPKTSAHPQHFSGTFWWANSYYIRRLPRPVPNSSRWEAEMWIGRGGPGEIYDVNAGLPSHKNWMHRRKELTAMAGENSDWETFLANSKIMGYWPGKVYTVPSTPVLRAVLDQGIHLTRLEMAFPHFERAYKLD